MFRPIRLSNQLTKKPLIAKISIKLLKLEFKSDNIIKSKPTEYIAKKILPHSEKRLLFHFI